MITTCTTCGRCYDSGSEEQANEPTRYCRDCWGKRTEILRSPPGPWKVAGIAWEVSPGVWTTHVHTSEFVRGVVVGHQARGRTEAEVGANARMIAAAPEMLQMLRDLDAHFAAHFGEQAWATSEIGGMTRVTIAKAAGGAH